MYADRQTECRLCVCVPMVRTGGHTGQRAERRLLVSEHEELQYFRQPAHPAGDVVSDHAGVY